ncbi:MAG TPA: ATP-binding cassette domain-containing protein [Amycolatopsis sp.]|nr:ATP-binding cassette domain-containing protein [Amycolatopsis sp.]
MTQDVVVRRRSQDRRFQERRFRQRGRAVALAGRRPRARTARSWLATTGRHGRPWFLAAAAADLLAGGGTVGVGWFLAGLITGGLRGGAEVTGQAGELSGLAVCGAVVAVSLFTADRLAAAGARRVEARIRARLLDTLLGADGSAERVTPGSAVTALADQVPRLGEYFRGYQRAAVAAVAVPALILAAAFPAAWVVGVLLMLALPIVPVNMAVTGLGAEELSRRQLRQIDRLSRQVLERLQAMSTLRALGALGTQRRVVARAAAELAARTSAVLRVAFLASTALEWVSTFAIGMVAMYTGATLLGYVHVPLLPVRLGDRQGVFALLLAPEFFLPLRRFAAAYHQRQDAVAAAEPIASLLDPPAGAPALDGATARRAVWSDRAPRVVLDRATVRFGGRSRAALSGIDLVIPAGHVLGVAGPSGAGKSTLLRVAGGWLAPDEGRCLVEDTPATDAPRALLLGQRPYLFAGTLADNLTLGGQGISRTRLWEAIELAQLTRVVDGLPDGLDTVLGERGWGLSGGEAQRVAIARGFLSTARFLIVDEPTAHLDAATENALIEPLRRLLHGRTALVASHSAAVLAVADHVVEIREGLLHG